MKIFIIFIFSFFLNECYAQSDTLIINSDKIFSITYREGYKTIFSLSEYSSYNEVYVDTLTKEYLVIERKFTDLKNPLVNSKVEKVALNDINSLGYITGNKGPIGALIGAGSGALAGFIIAALSINQDGQSNDKTNPKGIGIVSGLFFGTFLGYWFGTNTNQYELFDLSKYNNDPEKKYSEIWKIVQRGLKINGKK